jgi:hypothetical protein
MRNSLMAAAAAAGLIAIPCVAVAQSTVTTGVARGSGEVTGIGDGIAVEQRPAFREYIIHEQVPDYTIAERVEIGTVLPDTGVTVYDVPQRFGQTTGRYTVVNGETVLVEPRSRRIIQIID